MISLWPLLLPALILLGLLALTRPRRAVVLLPALLPAYLLRLKIAGLPTNFFELAVITVALAAAASRTQLRHQRQPALVKLFIALFLLASFASALLSPEQRTAWGIAKGWIAVPLLFAWLVHSTGTQSRTRRSMVNALLVSGVAMALAGLSQLGSVARVSGVYDVPNSLALFLAPLTVIAWWQRRRFISIILAAGLLAAQSAAALAAVIASLIIGVIIWPQRATRTAVVTLLLFVIVSLAYLTATGRLAYLTRPWEAQAPNSISVRLQLWSIAGELIREHPLRGIGLGAFEPAYQQELHQRFAAYKLQTTNYKLPAPLREFVFRDPHNWLLSFWLNTGLLGLVSFAGLNLWLLYRALWSPSALASQRLIIPLPKWGEGKVRGYADSTFTQALALALVSLLLVGLVDTIYWKNDLAALHWLLVALLLHQIRADREQNNPS